MLDEILNISKTEFLAYLKCPFMFYLMKELSNEKKQYIKINYSDYESELKEGIEKHYWLQTFHEKYLFDIKRSPEVLLQQYKESELWK